jgi:hypothetical protein
MKRKHLFELEDQKWFPSPFRSYITDVLIILNRKIGATRVIHDQIQHLIQEHGYSKIIDLGSGSGGPMPEVIQQIRQKDHLNHIELILTDLYPNPKAIETYEHVDGISYFESPIDAVHPKSIAEEGSLMTMINCFHHMRPDMAKKILRSTMESRTPIFIYELADNKIPFVIWLMMLPLGLFFNMISCLILTLFVRPIQPLQIIFTYIIPIIPFCFAWDGQISYTRIYTFEDIDTLVMGNESENYTWTKGYATNSDGKKMGIFLLGRPI